MKAFVLAVGLGLCGGGVCAQKAPAAGVESATAFKGANIALIHITDSTGIALKRLAQSLLSNGYTIASINKELSFIDTGYRTVKSSGVQVSLHFVVIPNDAGATIEARGTLTIPGLNSTIAAGESPIEKRGMNGSAYALAWQELERAVMAYPNGKVGYIRRP